MMNYAFETIRWLDVSTNLFVEALYRESEHFTQYVPGLYVRPDNGPINTRLLKERINLLLQSTSRLHSQFCPNPVPSLGGGSNGGNSGEGNENTDLSDNQAKVIGNQAFDKIRTDLNNNKVHLNHVSINNEGQALLNGVSAGPNTIGIITSCLNFMDEANVGPLATNFGRGISGLGLVIGGAQTYIAFTDENISLSDRLGVYLQH